MQYSICKDNTPRTTVKRIKQLLNEIGIYPKEEIIQFDPDYKYSPRSIRVYLDLWNMGVNGKGSNYINSRASGYAELMERLQNLFLPNFNDLRCQDFIKSPDEVYYDTKQLLDSEISRFYKDKTNLELLCKLNADKEKNKIIMTQWYSLKKQKSVLLPINIIEFIQGSNGMAAGNTKEEALVQAFSEICERYAMKHIIFNKTKMPNIPNEEIIKYDKIQNMIKCIENLGFKIIIKDASLNKNLPVVCVAFYYKKKNSIFLIYGSHPHLTLAIERCLTEFLQGVTIKNEDDNDFSNNLVSYISNDIEYNPDLIFRVSFRTKTSFNADSEFGKIFLCDEPEYQFNKNAFIDENILDNKKMLDFLIKNIKDITQNEIYIKDASFLNFPTVQIYAPYMSTIFNYETNELKELYEINWSYKLPLNDDKTTEEFIKKVDEYTNKYSNNLEVMSKLEILMLYALLKKDKNKLKKYINLFKAYKFCCFDKQILINEIIEDYYYINEKTNDRNTIENELLKKYKPEDVSHFFRILDTLSLNVITRLLNKEPKSTPVMTNLKRILADAYKKNIPNPNNLKSVFENIQI